VLYTYPAFVTAGSLALGWEMVSVPVLHHWPWHDRLDHGGPACTRHSPDRPAAGPRCLGHLHGLHPGEHTCAQGVEGGGGFLLRDGGSQPQLWAGGLSDGQNKDWLGPGGLDLGVVDRPGGDGPGRHGLPPGAEARGSLPRFHPQPGGAPDIVFGERLAAHSYSWVPRWRPYP